ncbi:DUF7210 family protein [Tsukamurella spumae]|uniref:DUF7210 domain-containing protein n=1 Tax=Tsukamurella spumae TaxID=44753 RepID=A0A846X0T5_9ACTN|nr:hypothetical protein [Tsukamurella spumae]NKY18864.1 hypothetical protein [Tsukamurella spumae]
MPKVTLKKNVKLDGTRTYEAGEVIEVSDAEANEIVKLKIGERVTAKLVEPKVKADKK